MMQQSRPEEPRPEEPLYSCVVSVSSLTGQPDEEVLAFGKSPEDAEHNLEALLHHYGYSSDQISALLEQTRVEALAPWCAPESRG